MIKATSQTAVALCPFLKASKNLPDKALPALFGQFQSHCPFLNSVTSGTNNINGASIDYSNASSSSKDKSKESRTYIKPITDILSKFKLFFCLFLVNC